MSVRVIPGEVEAKNATTRLVMPTPTQPAWPPFERVGETLATTTRQFPAHGHQGQEVLTYVIEGFASYQFDSNAPEPMLAGAVRLLTTPGKSSHRISPAIGSPIRWFNLVVTAGGPGASARLQSSEPTPGTRTAEGALVRPLVGPNAPLTSASGLEVVDLEFVASGTAFLKMGHRRRGVAYVVGGRGAVDNQNVDGGEAALIENAGGIALHGNPGFRVILSSAPFSG